MALGPVMLDIEGLALNPADRTLLREPAVGGVVLFSRNYETPAQVADLVAEIRADLEATEQPAPTAPEEIARVILESLALRYAEVVDRLQATIDALQKLEPRFSDKWWVHANIANLATRLGQTELARTSTERSKACARP